MSENDLQDSALAAVSHDQAYKERRSLNAARTVDIVQQNPGHTCAELAQISGEDRFMLARRLPDAANLKTPKLYRGAPRPCSVTGNSAITWWPIPVPQASLRSA